MNIENFTASFQALTQEMNKENNSIIPAIRKNAFDEFLKKGWPTSKQEAWKYSPIQNLLKSNIDRKVTTETNPKIQLQTFPFIKSNRLVFINGVWSEQYSHVIEKNIKIESLKAAFHSNPAKLNEYFTKIAPPNHDSLTALNTALFQEGLYINIPKNTTVAYPILIIHYTSDDFNDEMLHQRNFVHLEKNSEAVIIESYQSKSTSGCLMNQVNEILIEENASASCYQINIDKNDICLINTTVAFQFQSSRFQHFAINIGGKFIRNNIQSSLKGKAAEADLNGIYVLQENQHLDNRILVNHEMPECNSHQLFKGLMDGNSTAVFNGKIYVKQDAQKTNAFQSNKNMLLSEKATVNTMPQLEIYADDVKCSHGATVGQLDKNALFYLKSRGINEANARKILYQAFIGEVLEKIKIEPLKNYLLEESHIKFEE